MLVVASPGDNRALEAFSGLMTALIEKNAYALIRYCRIAGSPPKFGILSCNPKGQGLFCKIPFKEDLRPYSFPIIPWEIYKGDKRPVKKHKLDTRSTDYENSRSAISSFIDSMDLKNVKKDQRYCISKIIKSVVIKICIVLQL
jgi:hypothetical protein